MPILHVLRHAKSDRAAPVGDGDHDRPLSSRGRATAPLIGAHLAATYGTPDAVHTSSAARATETVELVLTALDAAPEVRREPSLYLADARSLRAHLSGVDAHVGSLLLVGHNPGLAELLVALAGDEARARIGRFPTAALATCVIQGGWADLDGGGADLVAVVTPRELA